MLRPFCTTFLLFAGCTEYGGIKFVSNTTAAAITVEPATLEFTDVPAGDTATKELTITNVGNAGLLLVDVSLAATDSFSLLDDLSDSMIDAGDSLAVAVSFSPQVTYEEGGLLIESNDPQAELTEVGLAGWGVVPVLQVTPDPVEFSSGEVACYGEEQAVTLENIGNATLTVDSLAVVGGTYDLSPGDETIGSYEPGDQRSLVITKQDLGEGELWIQSDDPRGDIMVELIEPAISTIEWDESDTLEIEPVWVDCPSTGLVRLERANDCGSGEIELLSATFSSPELSLVSPETLPHVFATGDPIELEVQVDATEEGSLRATMTLDFSNQDLDVQIAAEATPLSVEVLPSPLDLGTWPATCAPSETLVLSNPAACPITLESITASDDFITLDSLPDLPTALDADESVDIEVGAVMPEADGVDAQVYITDTSSGTTAVSVTATLGDAWVEDRYVRDGDWEAIDMLFYVDGSGSMADDQRRLADQAPAVVDALEQTEVDWHLAVVGATSGCFHSSVITAETEDAADAFEDDVLDVYGWHNEAGLHTTALALQRGRETGCNAGFLREDAGFFAMLVSDEPDQSPDTWDVELATIQGFAPSARVSAVAGDYPDGCSTALPGAGYYEAAEASNGTFLSICTSEWSDSIEDLLGELLSNPDEPYPLSQEPEPDTIQVTVDEVIRTDWSWDSTDNAVVFDEEGAVLPGEVVLISYEAACPEG